LRLTSSSRAVVEGWHRHEEESSTPLCACIELRQDPRRQAPLRHQGGAEGVKGPVQPWISCLHFRRPWIRHLHLRRPWICRRGGAEGAMEAATPWRWPRHGGGGGGSTPKATSPPQPLRMSCPQRRGVPWRWRRAGTGGGRSGCRWRRLGFQDLGLGERIGEGSRIPERRW
jgi:hypothetical protein